MVTATKRNPAKRSLAKRKPARLSPTTRQAAREAHKHYLAEKMQEATGGLLEFKYLPTAVSTATKPDGDTDSRGHVFWGMINARIDEDSPDSDVITVDDRDGPVEVQLALELRRIADVYERMSRQIQALSQGADPAKVLNRIRIAPLLVEIGGGKKPPRIVELPDPRERFCQTWNELNLDDEEVAYPVDERRAAADAKPHRNGRAKKLAVA